MSSIETESDLFSLFYIPVLVRILFLIILVIIYVVELDPTRNYCFLSFGIVLQTFSNFISKVGFMLSALYISIQHFDIHLFLL